MTSAVTSQKQTPGARKPKPRPPKTDLRAPKVAWLTLLLFVGCLAMWGCAVTLAWTGVLPMWCGVLGASIAAFAAFTPMHDASHRSVARAKWVNEVVGRISILLIIGPFPAFRYVHLEHHKHTNHDEKDPDMWSGRGPWWMLPLRWMTQDLHYYVLYLAKWPKRPTKEKWEILLTLVALWSLIGALCWWGYATPVLLLWVLPGRIAVTFLAYTFDYLPHKPHHITSAENRYRATLVRPSAVLTPVLLYQNYHLIHHLYPGVPFYRYAEIWRIQRQFLLEQGVETRDLLGHITHPLPQQPSDTENGSTADEHNTAPSAP